MKFCDRPYRFIYTEGYGEQGTIVMCPWMCYGVSREIGNILEEDLYTIWHGKKAQDLRKTIEDQTFLYCQKMSCPYLENDTLPDLSEEEFKKKAVPLEYPDMFNLAHDLTCNHKCPSCRYEIFNPTTEYRENVRKINEKILPYLNKAKTISADGLGDVFASPTMMELFEKMNPESPEDTHITFETNGVYSDRKHWERLSNLHKCKITVGVTPNSFDRATFKYLSGGLDDVDRVIENLYFLKEIRDKGEIDSFYITMVIQESNFRQLHDFVDRCLNDFNADQVILRTIYKWNKLTAEDYWFKDVMNPLHPYHKEMLEIIKDPILQDTRVYNWTAFNKHEKSLHPAYRYKEYMELTKKIIIEEISGEKLSQRLTAKGISSCILYGDNDLTRIIASLLDESGIDIKFVLARDIETDNQSIVKFRDYKPDRDDVIIITNFMDEGFVRRDLDAIGFEGMLISIKDLYMED